MDGEQIKNSCFSPTLLPTGKKHIHTQEQGKRHWWAVIWIYCQHVTHSGVFFFPSSFNLQPSFSSCHDITQGDGFHKQAHTLQGKQDSSVGHAGLCTAAPQHGSPGALSSKNSFGMNRSTHLLSFAGLRAARRRFLHTSLQAALHPCVLLPHPNCTFPPRKPDSSALRDDLCSFLLAVRYIQPFRDWVEPQLSSPFKPGLEKPMVIVCVTNALSHPASARGQQHPRSAREGAAGFLYLVQAKCSRMFGYLFVSKMFWTLQQQSGKITSRSRMNHSDCTSNSFTHCCSLITCKNQLRFTGMGGSQKSNFPGVRTQ